MSNKSFWQNVSNDLIRPPRSLRSTVLRSLKNRHLSYTIQKSLSIIAIEQTFSLSMAGLWGHSSQIPQLKQSKYSLDLFFEKYQMSEFMIKQPQMTSNDLRGHWGQLFWGCYKKGNSSVLSKKVSEWYPQSRPSPCPWLAFEVIVALFKFIQFILSKWYWIL